MGDRTTERAFPTKRLGGRRLPAAIVSFMAASLCNLAVRAQPPAAPPVPAAIAAPLYVNGAARLPPSAARHFAEVADSQTSPPERPEAELAYWQTSTNEGSGIQALEKRVKQLEAGQKKSAGDGKKAGFEHQIFGRMQADGVSFNQGPANLKQLGNAPNGTDFRRVRLGVQGAGYDVYFYRFEVDFVQPDPQTKKRPRITDMYFEIRELPWLGTFRIGQFREPYSVERLTSANDTTFIERGLPQALYLTSRNLGFMFYDNSRDEKWYWWNGLFDQNNTDFGEQFGDSPRLALVDRVTWVPWYDNATDGRYLLELGGAYNYQAVDNQTRSVSSTPEVSLQYDALSVIPNFVSTGNILMNHYQIVHAEASTVLGPLSFQAEYYGMLVDQLHNPNVFFHGMYVYASYFLTGEHRPYSRTQGVYTAVKPFSNFFRVGTNRGVAMGPGAWEVAGRFSSLNLSDRNIQGGRVNDVTFGLNWYATFQVRFSVNYIHAFLNRHNIASNADVVAGRAQVVW